MSTQVIHQYKCDNCESTKRVLATLVTPTGWLTTRMFYGEVAHACPQPECQAWLVKLAADNGLEIVR